MIDEQINAVDLIPLSDSERTTLDRGLRLSDAGFAHLQAPATMVRLLRLTNTPTLREVYRLLGTSPESFNNLSLEERVVLSRLFRQTL